MTRQRRISLVSASPTLSESESGEFSDATHLIKDNREEFV